MKRHLGLFAILTVTAVCHLAIQGAQARAAQSAPQATLPDIPAEFGDYRRVGSDLPVPDDVKRLLQTSSILMRNYVSPGGLPVQLAIVTGKDRKSLHFPEVCLVGQGWEVRDQYSSPVGIGFVSQRLVLAKGNRQEAVLYWFKTGETMTGSYVKNTLGWAWQKLLLKEPASSMIRLSAPIGRGGVEQSFAQLDDFAVQITPVLEENVP